MEQLNSNKNDIQLSASLKAQGLNRTMVLTLAVFLFALGASFWIFQNTLLQIINEPEPVIAQPVKNTISNTQKQDASKIKTQEDANNYFGLNIFNELTKKPSDNVFISPLSLSMAFSLVANGANGDTKTEIQKLLGTQNLDLATINNANKQLIESLEDNNKTNSTISDQGNTPYPGPLFRSGDKPVLKIANSLWTDKKYAFLPEFTTLSKDFYNASAQSLDFKDPKSLAAINDWVSEKTNGKIKEILNNLTSDMYLVNAVYFKSSWSNQFEKSATSNENFYLEDGTSKQVPLMKQTDNFNYLEEKDLQIISLPYAGNDYSMVIFLPNKNKKIDSFVSNMDWLKYKTYVNKLENKKGLVKMPKFKIEFSESLVPQLKKLGLVKSTSDLADFSKMSKDPMKISEVIHKTYIDVDENGTEAAAATAIGMLATSSIAREPIKPFEFTADHPFFFTIQDTKTNSIIFMGTVKNP